MFKNRVFKIFFFLSIMPFVFGVLGFFALWLTAVDITGISDKLFSFYEFFISFGFGEIPYIISSISTSLFFVYFFIKYKKSNKSKYKKEMKWSFCTLLIYISIFLTTFNVYNSCFLSDFLFLDNLLDIFSFLFIFVLFYFMIKSFIHGYFNKKDFLLKIKAWMFLSVILILIAIIMIGSQGVPFCSSEDLVPSVFQ